MEMGFFNYLDYYKDIHREKAVINVDNVNVI